MEYYISGLLISFGIYVILGASFNLLFGYGGLFSVAHGAFLGVGAYTTGILTIAGVDFLLALIIGVGLAILISVLLSVPTLKVSGDYLVLATLGFQIMITVLFSNLGFLTGGPGGLIGIPRPEIFGFQFTSYRLLVLLVAVFAAICIYLVQRSVKSPFGLILESIKEDETASSALGKNTVRLKIEVFAFTAGLAAVAGGLYAGYLQFISPVDFDVHKSISVLSLTVIGGIQTFWGPIVGAAFVVGLPAIFSFIDIPVSVSSLISGLLYSGLVIVFLLFRPRGILGKKRSAKYKSGMTNNAETRLDNLKVNSEGLIAAAGVRGKADQDTYENDIILEVKDLHKEFGGLKAVKDLSFSVKKGTCVGLIGPNGAGKTTVFNLITGVFKQNQGTVKYKGKSLNGSSTFVRARGGIARSFQEMRLFMNMSVLDNVMVAASNHKIEGLARSIAGGTKLRREVELSRERALSLVTFFGLAEKYNTTVSELSYAEQKLVMMARLLATGAECLLLDEPCSGLDHASRQVIIDTIQQLLKIGMTIVLIEHNLDVVREVCSRVVFLDHGTCIMEGSMAEVVASQELGAIYFGTQEQAPPALDEVG